MNKPWSELPNAHHIDWVLESVKENPLLWREAWLEARAPAWHATLTAARDAADAAADASAWVKSWEAAEAATDWRRRGRSRRWNAAREVAREVLLVLAIYDDCDQYINMSYEKLWVYAILSERPQAVLLLPMVYVREKLNERVCL